MAAAGGVCVCVCPGTVMGPLRAGSGLVAGGVSVCGSRDSGGALGCCEVCVCVCVGWGFQDSGAALGWERGRGSQLLSTNPFSSNAEVKAKAEKKRAHCKLQRGWLEGQAPDFSARGPSTTLHTRHRSPATENTSPKLIKKTSLRALPIVLHVPRANKPSPKKHQKAIKCKLKRDAKLILQ